MENIDKIREKSTIAEKGIISSIMMNLDAIDDIRATLTPDMFSNRILSEIYKAYLGAREDNKEYDLSSLCMDVENAMSGEDAPIEDVVMECAKSATTSVAIERHADTVKQCYANKQIALALMDIQKDPESAIDKITKLNEKVSGIISPPKPYESLAAITERNRDKYFCDKPTKNLKTGIEDFDDVIGEFEGGDLIVIGARPAVGKSALAAQIVNNLSHKGAKIGYFNLEMTDRQVFERFVATESGIGMTRIRRALRFMNDEKEKYNQACDRLEKKDRIIIPTGSKTVSEIRAITQREEFDIIVVDYLQLVKVEGRYKGNRFAEVGEISHALKAIAVDFQIPVIVLTQLNRESESKANKEPSMAEIRESGDIEQDASIILLLWNTDEEDRSKKGYKFDKNRQGTLKKGKLTFDGDRMKFYSEGDFIPSDLAELEIPFDV